VIYLDHAATTPMRPDAVAAMEPFLRATFGNPSGVHGISRDAKNALEAAREEAATLIGASRPLEIVFTGGGTEADNLAVVGAALSSARGGVVTAAVEHAAVLESARFVGRMGRDVSFIGVDGHGRLDPVEVADAVGEDTAVVSIMAANNETGVRQPVTKIAAAARSVAPQVVVHTDAVQAFISEPITVAATGADLISLAAHKFGGPKGVGILYVRDGVELEAVIHGGGQELGRRSGTHNVAGVVGMVAAMRGAVAERQTFHDRVGAIRDGFEEDLRSGIPDLEINAPVDDRLVQHAHVRIPGMDAETLLVRLDQAGVAGAAGSACHSGAIEVSHVLTAMGMSGVAAAECVRFSFGWSSTPDEAAEAARLVVEVVGTLR